LFLKNSAAYDLAGTIKNLVKNGVCSTTVEPNGMWNGAVWSSLTLWTVSSQTVSLQALFYIKNQWSCLAY